MRTGVIDLPYHVILPKGDRMGELSIHLGPDTARVRSDMMIGTDELADLGREIVRIALGLPSDEEIYIITGTEWNEMTAAMKDAGGELASIVREMEKEAG